MATKQTPINNYYYTPSQQKKQHQNDRNDDLDETERRKNANDYNSEVGQQSALVGQEENKNEGDTPAEEEDLKYATELMEDVTPEYYIAQEKRINNAHWMCRYFAHYI